MSNFLEITSNDNWFKLHPDKIAGVEYETTSFYFPIMVRGTKEDVLRVTGMLNNVKEHEKNVKKWQDFIREPLQAAIPKYLHEKSINEILKIEKDLNDQYNLKVKSKEEKKELLFKIWAISALAKAHDKAKTVNNYPDVDNEDLYNDDERLVKIIQAPEKAKIEKKREQLISKVSAIERRIAAYEKVKKEAGVDYYNYIILPDYKVLKRLFDKAYDTLKSFNLNKGYGDDNKYKEEEFIIKNQPQIDRTELLKNLISNQENRVKIAERLLSEAKKANEKTKAMRDLQTEQSALAESKAYFRVYNLKIAKAKAKAIKIKLSFSDALGIAEINPAKLFNRLYKKEATLSKKIDSGKYDNSINFSKMKNEQKELFNQMNDLTKNITEDDFYKHLAHNLCCSYEDFKPE